MKKEELVKLVSQRVSGQGNQVDLGAALPTILEAIIDGVIDYAELITQAKTLTGAINENRESIENMKGVGRFLSLWNAKTGMPTSNPSGTPYEYKTGDYFRVSVVADEGETNYQPDGTEYTGEASTVPFVGDLRVGDIFYFDGTDWLYQVNHADLWTGTQDEYDAIVTKSPTTIYLIFED